MSKTEVALVVDGNHLAYRNFWTLQRFTTRAGMHSGAFFGSVRTVRALIKKFNPAILIIVFDGKPKKQLALHKDYKRPRRDKKHHHVKQQLYRQLADLRGAFKHLGVFAIRHAQKEADPTVALLADYLSKKYRTFIVSSDSDYYQCLTEQIAIYDAIKDKIITVSSVLEATGLKTLHQVLMLKVLMGDKSDNIPSVKPRVGKVTATNLLLGPKSEWKAFKKEYAKEIAFNLALIRLPLAGETLPDRIFAKLMENPLLVKRKKFEKYLHKYELYSLLQDLKKWIKPYKQLCRLHRKANITGEALGRAGD